MAIRSPRRRRIASSRKASCRVARSRSAYAFVFGLSVTACADVLDIPSHPHLEDGATASAVQQPARDAGSVALVAAAPQAAPTAQGSSNVSEGETGGAPLLQTREPGATGAAPSAADGDAGTPAPSRGNSPDAAAAPSCVPMGSVGPNGRCFASLPALLTWNDGQQSCRALGPGWQLASIRSAAVNQFVAGLLTDQAWLAGSDAAVEGTWRWVDDGLEFSVTDQTGTRAFNGAYVNWNPGEPNGGGNSDCLRIVPALSATWADLQCDMLLGALCEGPGP